MINYISKNPLKTFTQQDLIAIRSIFLSKIFFIGLSLRIVVSLINHSDIQDELFLPFLSSSPILSVDPWSTFAADNQTSLNAFPYGFITYLYYKFFVQITYIGGLNSYFDPNIIGRLSLNLGTLVLDILSLVSIILFVQCDRLTARKILFLYWLSPINIYALYFHGQIDILPLFILLLSLLALQSWRFRFSGILLAVAISCKFSAAIFAPFYFMFVAKHKYYRKNLFSTLSVFAISLAIFFGCHSLLSSGFQLMVLGTPLTSRITEFSIVFDVNTIKTSFYLIPFLYLILIYYFMSIERVNWQNFICFTTLSVYILAVFVLPSPGWFAWIVPFAVMYIVTERGFSSKLYWLSSFQFLVYFLFEEINSSSNVSNFNNLAFTIMQSLMILQMYSIYKNGILASTFKNIFPVPFLMGISSNNEKYSRTLARNCGDLISGQRKFNLNMSDYTKFSNMNEKPPNIHLPYINDKANFYRYDFSKYLNDIYRLKSKLIPSQGRRKQKFKSLTSYSLTGLDFVTTCMDISFASNQLIENITDLNIAIIDSSGDNVENIQQEYCNTSDIVFLIIPSSEFCTGLIAPQSDRVKLKARIQRYYYQDALEKHLIAICGLNVDVFYPDSHDIVEITFDGDCSVEDLIMVLNSILPLAETLIADINYLKNGYEGLMQLLVITAMASRYTQQKGVEFLN